MGGNEPLASAALLHTDDAEIKLELQADRVQTDRQGTIIKMTLCVKQQVHRKVLRFLGHLQLPQLLPES